MTGVKCLPRENNPYALSEYHQNFRGKGRGKNGDRARSTHAPWRPGRPLRDRRAIYTEPRRAQSLDLVPEEDWSWNVAQDDPEPDYERDEEDDWGTVPKDEVHQKNKAKPILQMHVEHDLFSRGESSMERAAAYTAAQMQYDK